MVGEEDAGEERGGRLEPQPMPRGISLWSLRLSVGAASALAAEHVAVGLEDEVVGECEPQSSALRPVASIWEVVGRRFGFDGEVERHGEAEGVEAGAEVGGGGGEPEADGCGHG